MITAGVDEVGRGCLAGPVVSAAVILKEKINLKLLKDSKKISFKKRIEIAEHIKLNSTYAIGLATVEEILNLNILQAALLSMKRAINKLSIEPELVLIDGNFAPKGLKNFKTIFTDIVGLGLMRGLRVKDADTLASIISKSFESGVLVLKAGKNTLRFLPPLTISKNEIDEGFNRLEKAVENI